MTHYKHCTCIVPLHVIKKFECFLAVVTSVCLTISYLFFFFFNWDGWQRKAARLCVFVGIEEVPASAAEVDIHASVGSVCVDDIEETGTSLHCAADVNI